jgi:hypothetical protein
LAIKQILLANANLSIGDDPRKGLLGLLILQNFWRKLEESRRNVPCSYCTENCTNSLAPFVETTISHKKKKSIMVMNTRSGSQNDRQPIQPEPIIQSNQQPSPFPPSREGEQDRIVELEAHIEALTRQNAELLLRNM